MSKLPLFPPAALKVLSISTESDDAPDQFEEAFKSDPALAAELLLVVNSVAFGGRARIETIWHTLVFLGLEKVNTTAHTLAFCFYVRATSRTEYSRQIWCHSIATAVAAEKIAGLRGRANGYTAGLLHDLGRLVFLKSAGTEYAKEMMDTHHSLQESMELEKVRFGMTHCEVGSEVAQHWGFPESLQQCMAKHHDSVVRPADCEAHDVRLACQIATALGYAEFGLSNKEKPEPSGLHGTPDLDLADLSVEIAKRIEMMNP